MTFAARAWSRRTPPGLLEHPGGYALADDVELLLSELCTNAVQHGDGLDTVHLHCTPATVRAAVSDRNPALPTVRNAPAASHDLHLDYGRGLLLVAAIAATWGVDQHHNHGKTVRFELPIHRPPTVTR
ncbi:ATP-binding protein [Dactylosporangium sp. CS-047395]|uniref:ATP-binding protein n=1 Tax=Dactylosporangium sp. CS-047395 TaxID=3239936 RepID=UPI003D93DEA8